MKPGWQQNVIASVQLVFGLALLPTAIDADAQVPRASSGITALGLWLIAWVYTRMPVRMTRAVAMCSFCAAVWTFIFIFRAV